MIKQLITFENEQEDKVKFAALLLHHPTYPYEAAVALYPNDIGRSLYIFNNWIHDPLVKKSQTALLDEFGEEHFLPSKADAARKIWDRAQAAFDDDSFTKLMRLYADVCGFIKRPEVNIDNRQVTIAPKIMVMPSLMNLEEDAWEQGLKEQQRSLTLDPATKS